MSHRIPLLVLGLGNVLCGDDGVGPAAIAELDRRYLVPEGVHLADGGTLGLTLLPLLADAERVLLIDAVRTDAPAGTMVRLLGEEVAPAVRARLSVHQIGVADVLDGLELCGHWPRRIALLGLVPETMELQLERSPAVQRMLVQLVDAVAEEATRWGYVFVPRTVDALAEESFGARVGAASR